MTIQEAQDIVDQWINTIGVRYYNELTNTAVLMEEVGEMARAYGKNLWRTVFQGPQTSRDGKRRLER